MTSARVLAIASIVVLSGSPAAAQELSRYREYPLGSSIASVAKISGARESDTKTLHERPALIQQLEWRAPYVKAGTEMADPVRDISFGFVNGQLYQVLVTYDRDRMDGLTNDDVIGSLSAPYGVPSLTRIAPGALPADVPADAMVVARWEDAASLVILTRGIYSAPFQLLVISKTLNTSARAAIRQARRLEMQEAPQRERDQREEPPPPAKPVRRLAS